MKCAIIFAAAIAVAIAVPGPAPLAAPLERIIVKGYVQCGVSKGLPGFSNADANGNWSGIDVDVCRAIAAALFGDSERVKYTPLSSVRRFKALRSGEIDVLSRNSTWTLSRDASGLEFAGITYYDGQAFMVPEDLGVSSALELGGAAICVAKGTTTVHNAEDYFRANGMTVTLVEFDTYAEAKAAYEAGKMCEVFTADQSALHAQRTTLSEPDAHIILPEVISREPLGPVVCQSACNDASDDQWVEVIRWTLYAMLEAEALGINSRNVDELWERSQNPAVLRLLGTEGNLGEQLGLSGDWAYNIIKQVGNYAEVFERNLGPNTPLKLSRGKNALWKDGGLHYPMPFL